MKTKILLPLILLFFFAGCSKDEGNTVASQQYSITLSGSSFAGKNSKWQISSLMINAVSQTLTTAQKTFQKQYTSDGKFSDSDGLMGTWSIPVTDSLIENYSNLSSGVNVRQGYKIANLSNVQMSLTYTVNGSNVTTVYTSVP